MFSASKQLATPILCCTVNTAVMLCRCMCAVGIWAEVELDSRIMDKSSSVNNYLDSVLNSQSASVRLKGMWQYYKG